MFSLRAGPFVHVAWNVAVSGCVCLRSARVALDRRATYSLEIYRAAVTPSALTRRSRFIAFRAAGRGMLLEKLIVKKRKTTVFCERLHWGLFACKGSRIMQNLYPADVSFILWTLKNMQL